jgi:bacterioferritin-associated ferredoxin
MIALSRSLGFTGRDQIKISYQWNGDRLQVTKAQLKGGLDFIRETRALLKDEVQGKSRSHIKALLQRPEPLSPLLTEMLELLLGESSRPYKDAELCHCRVVPTMKVIEAIHYGADSVQEIARRTSAGTGCGTCQVQSDKLIDFYLRRDTKN